MSEGNVEVVLRSAQSVFDEDPIPVELYDPQVKFQTRGEIEGHIIFTGHDGIRRAIANFRQAWKRIRGEPQAIIEGKSVLVVAWHITVTGHSDIELEVDEGWAYWLRDGKIHRIEQHPSKQEALEAAGLRE